MRNQEKLEKNNKQKTNKKKPPGVEEKKISYKEYKIMNQ